MNEVTLLGDQSELSRLVSLALPLPFFEVPNLDDAGLVVGAGRIAACVGGCFGRLTGSLAGILGLPFRFLAAVAVYVGAEDAPSSEDIVDD